MPVTTIAPEFRKLGYQVASLGINVSLEWIEISAMLAENSKGP